MHPRIFISYSHKDDAIAFRLARHLRDWGCDVWIDRYNLPAGSIFPQEIARAIASSNYFIVLLSPDSVSRDWVLREIDMALTQKWVESKPAVIPALIRDCDIPELLRPITFADFRTGYIQGLTQLIDGILQTWQKNPDSAGSASVNQVIERLLSCPDSDQEISQVLREHAIELGKLVTLEPEIFVDRREEIRLFLNILRPGSGQRGLIFFYRENESRMGISYLLRLLAYAGWDQLIHLAGETEMTESEFSGIRRLLFHSEENTFESFSRYIQILDRTVEAIGDNYFTTYISCKTSILRDASPIRHMAETFAREPFYRLLLNLTAASELPRPLPRDLLDCLDNPQIRTQMTIAFLSDLARSPGRVVWLFDGPWAHLEEDTMEWLCSILRKVGRREVQNLWLVFGDKEPIVPLDSVASYPVLSPWEIRKFTPDVVRDFLQIVLREEDVDLLTTAIWSGTGGHPARVAYTIKQVRSQHPSRCRPVLEPGNYGVLIPEWIPSL